MDNTLVYGLATLGVGVAGLVIRYGFKSKCSDVSLCCGLLAIKRDVESEVKAEQIDLELARPHHSPSSQSLN
jgi:hypothetical protein